MLTPTLIARGPVFSPATSKDGHIMAWSNRKSGTRDIYVRRDGQTTQLTNDPEIDTEPAMTPEGDILIWSRRVGSDWDLYQSVDGEISPLVTGDGAQRKPQISGDGSTLVFEDNDGIGLMRDGARKRFAPPQGSEISRRPLVSHDGSRIFYERFDQATRSTTVWMRDQDGVEKPILTPDDSFTEYTISRNGRQVTYAEWTDKGKDLHVWDLDTDERRVLAGKEDVNEAFPSVTEDGQTTFYTLADFRGWPKVNTYIFKDHENVKTELVTRDPEGRNLFARVTQDANQLNWMWIADDDPNNRALYSAEL